MHPELEDCLELLTSSGCVAADPDRSELVQACCCEAQRVMSAQGLDYYLQGGRALSGLGKGQDLLLTYLQEMPSVVKAVGEDVLPDIVEALMQMASLTSGAVLTRVLASLPLAASRLGDAELLRAYLRLLHQLAAKAPRGLRPMTESLEELLSCLTLGGLRRWALWGAEAYQRDFEGQLEYFAVDSVTSRSIIKRERRGCLLVDHQRKLNLYLLALWGRALPMRPTSGDFETREGKRPFIEDYQLLLPDAFDSWHGIDGIEIYRAAAAHAAAHLAYTDTAVALEGLDALQLACVELFEDGRVEHLACQRFPGLRRLWSRFFKRQSEVGEISRDSTIGFMLRSARAILDRDYRDEADWIRDISDSFHCELERDSAGSSLALEFGLRYHRQLLDHGSPLTSNALLAWPIPYRDDNRYFRDFDSSLAAFESESLPWRQPTRRKRVGLMQMVNEIDSELEDGSPQEVWVLPTELFPYEDHGVSYNQSEGGPSVSPPFHYPEWDYRVQLARPDWSTLVEHRPQRGDPTRIDQILEAYKPLANRMKQLIDRMQPSGVVRRRGYEDGDELDIDAAVAAMTDVRRGVMPDPRVNIRITRHTRDLSLLVLMDLSASTNDPALRQGEADGEQAATILDLTREACGLLAWAVDSIGDNFALHGFASEGRHDVRYFRFKDFDEAYDETARARLAGMRGGLSTRMGTALRHGGRQLLQQANSKRLLLLITDGEPADIDERDPRYLREDCRQAVNELAGQGVRSFCLTLDAQADAYVERIFGANNYSIVDNIAALPERLPRVFSTLTA